MFKGLKAKWLGGYIVAPAATGAVQETSQSLKDILVAGEYDDRTDTEKLDDLLNSAIWGSIGEVAGFGIGFVSSSNIRQRIRQKAVEDGYDYKTANNIAMAVTQNPENVAGDILDVIDREMKHPVELTAEQREKIIADGEKAIEMSRGLNTEEAKATVSFYDRFVNTLTKNGIDNDEANSQAAFVTSLVKNEYEQRKDNNLSLTDIQRAYFDFDLINKPNVKAVNENGQLSELMTEEEINDIVQERGEADKYYSLGRETLRPWDTEHRGRGYIGKSMSVNMAEAQAENRLPATSAGKALGVSPQAIREVLGSTEWHHTGSYYNETPVYDINAYLDLKNGKELSTEDYTLEEIEEIKSNWEKIKSYKQPAKEVKQYYGNAKWLTWEGTKQHPKAVEHSENNILIEEKGSFYTFHLPDGTTVKKKIGSNGTSVVSEEEAQAREQRKAREQELQAEIDQLLEKHKPEYDAYRKENKLDKPDFSTFEKFDTDSNSWGDNFYITGQKPTSAQKEKGLRRVHFARAIDNAYFKAQREIEYIETQLEYAVGKKNKARYAEELEKANDELNRIKKEQPELVNEKDHYELQEWDGENWRTLETQNDFDDDNRNKEYPKKLYDFLGEDTERFTALSNELYDIRTSGVYYQTAFSGSRVDYDRPSLEAIGSGEGEQVHGWGLYYALNKDVAERYRYSFVGGASHLDLEEGDFAIGDKTIEGWLNGYEWFNDDENIKRHIVDEIKEDAKKYKDDTFELRQRILYILSAYQSDYAYRAIKEKDEEKKNHYQQNIDNLENLRQELATYSSREYIFDSAKGQVHEVDIPENPYLLDEQKPFSEQSEFVKERLNQLLHDNLFSEYVQEGKTLDDFAKEEITDWKQGFNGGQIYDRLSNLIGSDEPASRFLEQYGIKGITYYGQQDGRCFVIFNPDDVKVIQKFYSESGTRDVRGLYNPSEHLIELFRDARPDTLTHELSHHYFMTHFNFSQRYGYTEQDKGVMKWLSRVGGHQITSVEEMEHQDWENLTEAFVRYLNTSNSPTIATRGLFQKAKDWILEVFTDNRAYANNEVKDFFDSLISSEGEIPNLKNIIKDKADLEEALSKAQKGESATFRGVGRKEIQALQKAIHTRIRRDGLTLEQELKNLGYRIDDGRLISKDGVVPDDKLAEILLEHAFATEINDCQNRGGGRNSSYQPETIRIAGKCNRHIHSPERGKHRGNRKNNSNCSEEFHYQINIIVDDTSESIHHSLQNGAVHIHHFYRLFVFYNYIIKHIGVVTVKSGKLCHSRCAHQAEQFQQYQVVVT